MRRPAGVLPDPVCERCGTQLTTASRFQAVSASGQCMVFGHDGGTALFPMGGVVACSWSCLAVLAAQRAGADAPAAVRMVAERERQVTQEGWSPEHDAGIPAGELGRAGVHYAVYALTDDLLGQFEVHVVPDSQLEARKLWRWPWDPEWWKPKNRDRDLIRAGALIAAELDRDPSRRPTGSGEAF